MPRKNVNVRKQLCRKLFAQGSTTSLKPLSDWSSTTGIDSAVTAKICPLQLLPEELLLVVAKILPVKVL